jgi:outer membrane biosynthesis protein TonB
MKHCIWTALIMLLLATTAASAAVTEGEQKREEKNPLLVVSKHMDAVGRRLEKGDTGIKTTQKHQQRIMAWLDQLIEQSQPPSGGGQNPQQKPQPKPQPKEQEQKPQSSPQNTSQEQKQQKQQQKQQNQGGASGQSPTQASREPEGDIPADAGWGTLPPRTRSEVFQALQEDFPEEYKALLKLYYKTLAEQEE